jgi:hypothetical protein
MNELAEAGTLNAETLVEVSRPEDAPLHNEFEWDDTKAAESWRKHQGRNIINALIMTPEAEEEQNKEPIRAFFKVSASEQYESTNVLIQSQNGRDSLRDQARKELLSYRMKFYSVLKWTGAEIGVMQALEELDKAQ